MVACNSHQTTPRSRARDQLSQYFIGLCLKFEILSREPPQLKKYVGANIDDELDDLTPPAVRTNALHRRLFGPTGRNHRLS